MYHLEVTDYIGIEGATDEEGNSEVNELLKDNDFWMYLFSNGSEWGLRNVWYYVEEDTTSQEIIEAAQSIVEEIWQDAKPEEGDDEFVQDANDQIEEVKNFAELLREKQT